MDGSAREPTAADFTAIAGNLRAATGGAAPHHALQLMQELTDAASPGGADRAAVAPPNAPTGRRSRRCICAWRPG